MDVLKTKLNLVWLLQRFTTDTRRLRSGIYSFALALILTITLSGCASMGKPQNTENLCMLFQERGWWYRAALQAEKRWYVDIPVMMSIIYQESSYVHNARPKRKRLLGIIPLSPSSSAYGYAQAQIPAWRDYIKRNRRLGATRDNFADAVDFVGWYTDTAARHLRLSRTDAKHLYLSYHEGLNGYRKGNWRSNDWLVAAANKVQVRADRYREQLLSCRRGPARRYRGI